MNLPTFRYEPLSASDSVRALVLQPSEDYDSALRCEVIQYTRLESSASLDSNRHYEAVSYTWGEPVFSHQILCESGDRISQLKVTQMVDTMLRHLRKKTSPRFLWIDAISLNQDDEAEIMEQIPMMGSIYGMAKKVHIWLGRDSGDARKTFAYFRGICAISDDDPNFATKSNSLAYRILGGEALQTLKRFLETPWFSRRWIIQEVAMARYAIVRYGNETIAWVSLQHAMGKTMAAVQDRRSFSDFSYAILSTFSGLSAQRKSILELLWDFAGSQCSDERDRVAALFGLSTEGRDGSRSLSYQSHWTQIYRDFAMESLSKDRSLSLLLHLLAFRPLSLRYKDIPSWVPDWSRPRQHYSLIPNQTQFMRKAIRKPERDLNDMNWSDHHWIEKGSEPGEIILPYLADKGQLLTFVGAGNDSVDTRVNLLRFVQSQKSNKIGNAYCDTHKKYHKQLTARAVCLLASFICVVSLDKASVTENDFKTTERYLESALEEGASKSEDQERVFRQLHEILKLYTLFTTGKGMMAFGTVDIQECKNARVFVLPDSPLSSVHGVNTGLVLDEHQKISRTLADKVLPSLLISPRPCRTKGRILAPCFYTWDLRFDPMRNVTHAENVLIT
ncbi:MAG: hypothetical protein Q9160_008230 [Pyrenula sp. 1 TL-2023]